MHAPEDVGADLFSHLLQQLEDQHSREVRKLRETIDDLKSQGVDGLSLPEVDTRMPHVESTALSGILLRNAAGVPGAAAQQSERAELMVASWCNTFRVRAPEGDLESDPESFDGACREETSGGLPSDLHFRPQTPPLDLHFRAEPETKGGPPSDLNFRAEPETNGGPPSDLNFRAEPEGQTVYENSAESWCVKAPEIQHDEADPRLQLQSRGVLRHSNSHIEEKTDTQTLCSRCLHALSAVMKVCIIINIFTIFAGVEYDGYCVAVSVQLEPPGRWPDLRLLFSASEYFFCTIFAIELLVRLARFRFRYFYSTHLEVLNIIDALVVFISAFDLYIMKTLLGTVYHEDAEKLDLTVLRILRFGRLVRAVRVLRMFEIFRKLRELMSTIVASFQSLFRSMVALFFAMLMFALIMAQLVQPYIADPSISETAMRWMFKHYGTAGRSLWTVFEITFSGGWPNYCRPLIEDISPMFAYVFSVYISIVYFSMIRIITALFLRDTLQEAAHKAEIAMLKNLKNKQKCARKLLDALHVAGVLGNCRTTHDGKLYLEDFEVLMQDSKVKAYLTELELDTHETKTLLSLLDDGEGQVMPEEFVQGAMRLKGTTRSQDVISIMHDCNSIKQAVEEIHQKVMRDDAEALA